MDHVDRAYKQLQTLIGSMTPAARWTAGLFVVAVVVMLGYLGSHRGERQYVDLMHGVSVNAAQLPAMEAAMAKAKLEDHQIRGNSIHVPRGREAVYMAALADAGALPPNFGDAITEAIRDSNLFMSSRDREELTKKATQAELSLMIRSMKGIENAYVLYDIDKRPGGFSKKLITATVSVKPAGTDQLHESRVSAIRHLVAGAIAGLKPEDVTVSDLNGRTWHGEVAAGGDDENRFLALKRTHEQDLKAKILNSLSFIPNITVEPCVTLDRDSSSPVAARVSVGVPSDYFKRIWRERSAGVPDPSTMARIQEEETAKIQRHVAQLLPLPQGNADFAELVAVTAFEEVGDEKTSVAAVAAKMLGSLWPYLSVIGVAVFALIGFIVVRFVARSVSAGRSEPVASESTEASVVPAPHWTQRTETARTPRDELAAMVDEDPEAAANILRNWIGQAS